MIYPLWSDAMIFLFVPAATGSGAAGMTRGADCPARSADGN